MSSRQETEKQKNPWQHDTESVMQVLKSICVGVKHGISLDVLRIQGDIQDRCLVPIGDLRYTTSNVMVKIERNGTVRHSFVAAQ